MREYAGILFIGDPHLSSRNPGFRKDDYPRATLGKLRWCFDYAKAEGLLIVLLGDLFHWPRDNANWLLTEVLSLCAGREIIAITGNHDTTEKTLIDDDSLSVVAAAGGIKLLDRIGPWRGTIAGKDIFIGGTCWSDPLPNACEETADLVIWLAHHNIKFGGVEEPWLKPRELPGIDILINGHLHRPFPDIVRGSTTWMNPGNISRVQRADAVREARPSVLRLDFPADPSWRATRVEVPHASFDEVFHEMGPEDAIAAEGSAFIKGLESLRTLKTAGGVGLREFLEKNLTTFPPAVAAEIMTLAEEVCTDEQG